MSARLCVFVLATLSALSLGCDKRIVSSAEPEVIPDLTRGSLVFSDDFERATLGDDWSAQGRSWRLADGVLHVAGARNDALWLGQALPDQVRVEFDARAGSDIGDLKFEIFGNGTDHESGYLAIYGGWSNQVTCIARLDEHGDDRLDAPDHQRVVPGQTYRFAAVRTDHRFRWYIDGNLVLSFEDDEPLTGEGHRHFAFNDWDAPVEFDNLRIYDLSQ